MSDVVKLHRTERTSTGLRDYLFEELDALRNGDSNPQRAGAAAKISREINNSVRVEIAHQHFVQSLQNAGNKVCKPAKLQLGSNEKTGKAPK